MACFGLPEVITINMWYWVIGTVYRIVPHLLWLMIVYCRNGLTLIYYPIGFIMQIFVGFTHKNYSIWEYHFKNTPQLKSNTATKYDTKKLNKKKNTNTNTERKLEFSRLFNSCREL